MSTQDKIKELAQAALRSAPPSGGIPKPATFMPSSVKPAVPTILPAPAPVAGSTTEQETQAATAEAPVVAFKDEGDPELRSMIESREQQFSKRMFQQRLAVSLCVVTLIGGSVGWIWTSASARSWLGSIVPALSGAGQDVRMMGSMVSQYDASLEQIGSHGDRIGVATRDLGVDPATVDKDEDDGTELTLVPEEEGLSAASRNRVMREKFGVVEKLAGRDSRSSD